MSWPILIVAFICLIGGIGLFLWAVRRPRARFVNSTNLLAWLLVGLFPTLIIFSFFPNSSAEGDLVGFGLGGAVAAFAAIFVFGSRAGARAIERDQKFDELVAENERLRDGEAAGDGGARTEENVIRDQRHLNFRTRGTRRRELVIITGDLTQVRGIDVWVSSENTNMQMARYYDRSVSGLVRYLGARRSEGGHPVEDLVADDLAAAMGRVGGLSVEPATVLATTSGELVRTHGVKRIYHVAAVHGQVGVGYRPVGNVADCVTNALAKLDSDGEREYDCRTILFPPLGTGTAGGTSAEILRQLIRSAAEYERNRTDTKLKTAYFLVRTREDLLLAARAADSCDALTRAGGSAESLLELDLADVRS